MRKRRKTSAIPIKLILYSTTIVDTNYTILGAPECSWNAQLLYFASSNLLLYRTFGISDFWHLPGIVITQLALDFDLIFLQQGGGSAIRHLEHAANFLVTPSKKDLLRSEIDAKTGGKGMDAI